MAIETLGDVRMRRREMELPAGPPWLLLTAGAKRARIRAICIFSLIKRCGAATCQCREKAGDKHQLGPATYCSVYRHLLFVCLAVHLRLTLDTRPMAQKDSARAQSIPDRDQLGRLMNDDGQRHTDNSQ